MKYIIAIFIETALNLYVAFEPVWTFKNINTMTLSGLHHLLVTWLIFHKIVGTQSTVKQLAYMLVSFSCVRLCPAVVRI